MVLLLSPLFLLGPGPQPAVSGEVDVVQATALPMNDGSYQFRVTLRHADQGWKHYADKWEILTLDGKLLGRRVLLHPHENEQPFTRSLGGVKIPRHIKKFQEY